MDHFCKGGVPRETWGGGLVFLNFCNYLSRFKCKGDVWTCDRFWGDGDRVGRTSGIQSHLFIWLST